MKYLISTNSGFSDNFSEFNANTVLFITIGVLLIAIIVLSICCCRYKKQYAELNKKLNEKDSKTEFTEVGQLTT